MYLAFLLSMFLHQQQALVSMEFLIVVTSATLQSVKIRGLSVMYIFEFLVRTSMYVHALVDTRTIPTTVQYWCRIFWRVVSRSGSVVGNIQ